MLELQAVREVAEAQRVETAILKGKVQEMEAKSAKLEKEINLLKAEVQELCQHLEKNTPVLEKNKAQPIEQRKNSEVSAVRDKEVCLNQSQKNEGATPATQSSVTGDVNAYTEK